MKRIILLSITLTAGFALAHPFAVFGEDQPNPNDKKLLKKNVTQQQTGKPVTQVNAGQQNNFHKNVNNTAGNGVNPAFTKHNSSNQNVVVTPPNTQVVQQHNTKGNFHTNTVVNNNNSQVVTNQNRGQFTRANGYGGRWTAGTNFHTDWDHGREHDWNGHHYRWYDGGWLIVDGGFWPVATVAVYSGNSLVSNAQQQLANLGYYNGPIDGDAGPGTRSAIARFQNDNGIPPSGRLNFPTRQALGLQ